MHPKPLVIHAFLEAISACQNIKYPLRNTWYFGMSKSPLKTLDKTKQNIIEMCTLQFDEKIYARRSGLKCRDLEMCTLRFDEKI